MYAKRSVVFYALTRIKRSSKATQTVPALDPRRPALHIMLASLSFARAESAGAGEVKVKHQNAGEKRAQERSANRKL